MTDLAESHRSSGELGALNQMAKWAVEAVELRLRLAALVAAATPYVDGEGAQDDSRWAALDDALVSACDLLADLEADRG